MNEFSMKYFADYLKISEEQILAEQDSSDIWSSLEWMEIVFSIEEEYDIRFDQGELFELKTPRKLFEAVQLKLSRKHKLKM